MRTTVAVGESLSLGTPPVLDPPWPETGQISTVWQRQNSIGGNGWTDIGGTVNQATYTTTAADGYKNIRAKWCHHGAYNGARVNAFSQSVFCASGILPVGSRWPLNTGDVYIAAHVTGTGEYGDGAYANDGMNELGQRYYILIAPRAITEMEDRHPANTEAKWHQQTPGLWGSSIPADVDRGVLENKSYGRPFYELYKDLIPGLAFLQPDYVPSEFANPGPNSAERAAAYGGGATPWYLPAQYELELMYKLFKPYYSSAESKNVVGQGFGINPILDPPETRDYENFDNSNPDTTEDRPTKSIYDSFTSHGKNHFYGSVSTIADENLDTGYWMSTHEPGDTIGHHTYGTQSHMLKSLSFRNGDQVNRYAVAPQAQDAGLLLRAIRRERFDALDDYFANNP